MTDDNAAVDFVVGAVVVVVVVVGGGGGVDARVDNTGTDSPGTGTGEA